MPHDRGLIFPLVARRRVAGVRFGPLPSVRRGSGFDIAGSRPYRPGDDIRRIDRHASARLSALAERDEFVVREHYTEEAVPVVIVADGAPSMALFPEGLPWLRKPAAVAAAAEIIAQSAREARCRVEHASGARGLADTLVELGARRGPRAGSFVFLLSDFFSFPPDDAWARALEREWDLVPVVVQDPIWERSFPDVAGAVLPLADAETGKVRLVRLGRREIEARRTENEERLARIDERFAALGLAPVHVADNDPVAIHESFLEWAEGRGHEGRWLP